MSQSGLTDPAAGSHLASASAAGDKPIVASTKAPSDDEAEEGEILDEEEGEISESRPSEPATSSAAPTQSTSANVERPSQPSPKQPSTPELPSRKTFDRELKDADGSEAFPIEAPGSEPAKVDVQSSQDIEPGQLAAEQDQPPADSATALATEATSNDTAAREASAEQVHAEIAAPPTTTDAVAESHEDAEKVTTPQEAEEPSTPQIPETAELKSEEIAIAASLPQEESKDDRMEEDKQTLTEVPVSSITPPAADEQAASIGEHPAVEASENNGPVDMDVDEKVASPKQPAANENDKPVESVPEPEPMQVDDAVHTPALPSEGPEAPVEASTVSAVENAVEITKPAQEVAQSPPHVKIEPQAESYEQPPPQATQTTEPVQSEPAKSTRPSREETMQKEEPSTVEPHTEAQLPKEPAEPTDSRHRSPTPPADVVSSLEAPRSEESHQRAPVERDEPRRASAEPLRSRNSNRGSAAPSSLHERRVERTKERSHPAERSQDREQRAREKDRRRELERLERERERERERIRESERNAEMMIARENEEARLIWLSLPGNDHPQYYTDTDSDSCYGVGGALGVELTDEEDQDLNPPLPLSLQEYHPAPSYSQSYFDDSFHASKRKRTDDGSDDDLPASSRRFRRKPVSGEDRFASSSSRQVPREALPSTTMIDIDDFPVPDSSIRGEPSERPFASRIERASLPRIFPYGRTDDALEEYDSSDSDEEAMRIAEERKRRHGNRNGNRGNKLSRDKGSRWIRRGKLGGWTEMRMEKEIGDRVRHRVEAMQKDNVRALLSAMPEEDKAMLAQFPALRYGLIPSDAPSNARRDARGRLLPSDISEAARIDAELGLDGGSAGPSGSRLQRPEHLTSTSLAPTLLKPAITPRQLLTSHTLRHTFRNPHIAALGKTALDLIESEGVVGRAVGRCWAAMERGGWNEDPEPKGDELDGVEATEVQNGISANGMDIDGSDAETPARHVNGDVASSSMFGSPIDNPALSHLDKLFVTKQGLAIPRLDDMGQPIFVPPSPSTQAARAQTGMAEEAASEAVIETTLLPAPEQRSIVLAALECLHDLAADSREYVERLEEVRSRLAAVKRRRAQVWNAVRQWALDKDIEATSLANGGRVDLDATSKSAGAAGAAAVEAAAALSSAATAAATVGTNGSSPRKRK
ncbi:uncharacterized protein UTRI_01833_B [Ustilago trichophora]|uniref:Uncharacterized protein n=1 Tax=Ustilago trichophora TaxID=86804 RepID=A0A5C3E435_9BASI|nr:uncharacterized protein UTRI_01833_B [Ustilago trichophora]